MNRFNTLANVWDDNPCRIRYSEAIGDYINARINREQRLQALEVGSDTGTLSVYLNESFSRIDMLDSSQKLIDETTKKLEENHIYHLTPIRGKIQRFSSKAAYDVLYSVMFLHHIIDTDMVLGKFASFLNTGGKLFVCDLYIEDGRFHPGTTEGVYHHGFDPDKLANTLKTLGFAINNIETVYNFDRNDRLYPMFLIEATKQ